MLYSVVKSRRQSVSLDPVHGDLITRPDGSCSTMPEIPPPRSLPFESLMVISLLGFFAMSAFILAIR